MEKDSKTEGSKVVLQVNQRSTSGSEIDLINVFSHMGKRKKLIAYLVSLAILVGITCGAFYSGFEHLVGKGSYSRAMISFQYKGIENGLDPNGAAFDINTIKSPYVIQRALNNLGIEENYIESVRENITIQGVVPEDAVERITVINQVAEKEPKYYENLLDVTYFPSKYIIYFYDDGTFGSRQMTQILNEILDSYKQYFLETYANSAVMSVTSNLLGDNNYDYGESVNLVKTQIDIMLSYVREKMEEAPDFRAASTGLSFEDIVTALEFERTVDVAKLSAYVESMALTKDKQRQTEYYDYLVRECSNRLSELQTTLDKTTQAIADYEKDPVVIVSNSDSTTEYSQKNEYYDTLVTKQLNINAQIAKENKNLNEYYLLLSKFQDSDRVFSQSDFDYADSLLNNINATIASWVSLTERTTEEYFSTTLFSNAVTIAVPAQYFVDGGIKHILMNMAVPAAVLVLLVLIWWFYCGVRQEIVRMRSKKSEDSNKETGKIQSIQGVSGD